MFRVLPHRPDGTNTATVSYKRHHFPPRIITHAVWLCYSLTGGAGNDVFIFGPSFGKDTITDFAAGGSSVDAIEFDDDVFADFASVLAAVSRVGSDTLIAVNVNTRVMLKNVALANLH